jgi:Zn-dependent metalloprotease
MSTQSINTQITQLKELLKFTNSFMNDLKINIGKYSTKVNQLYNSGVPIEFKNNFEVNNHQPTKKQINLIIEQMTQRDIPFLKQQIQSLEQALEIARRNRR